MRASINLPFLTDRSSNSVVQDGVVGLVDALAYLHGASFDGELEGERREGKMQFILNRDRIYCYSVS